MNRIENRVLIIGHTGFLGSFLASALGRGSLSVDVVDRAVFDLAKPPTRDFSDFLEAGNFQYAIICAAITDVEKCHRDQSLSEQVNVHGQRALLGLLKQAGVIPVFFSSDYVFSGRSSPYLEDDNRNPTTVYGRQKLAIENHLEANFEKRLVFRTSKLMSRTRHPRNILYPLIRDLAAGKVSRCAEDQRLTPVFIEDIAAALTAAIRQDLSGTFHLGTRRVYTRAELGRFLASSLGFEPKLIESIRLADIGTSEPRPTNNALNCVKIEQALDFSFLEIADSLPALRQLAD
jgi:dTDP-4-dehydrorhamnose reductase